MLGLLGIFFFSNYLGTVTFVPGGVETAASAPSGLLLITFLVIIGFGTKAGMFPMHGWPVSYTHLISGAGARRDRARGGGTGMTIVTQMMLIFLIMCAIAVCLTRNLLTSVIIYMGYSMIMSIIWITLESPDLAITEAAVGAGITSLLFFLTLKKIHAIDARNEVRRAHERQEKDGGADNGNA